MGYPSRPNLNCFLSFNEASAKGDEFRFHSEESTFVEWGKPLSIPFTGGVGNQLTKTPTPPSLFVAPTGVEPVFLG